MIYLINYAFWNKSEYLNLIVFNIITVINEWKTLTRHISCECKCKFEKRKCNFDQWWNNNKCRWECKKCHVCEKDYVWNPATCSCENRKYLARIIDNSAITYDEVIESYDEETKTIPTNFNEKKQLVKYKISILSILKFLLITTALLIVVSIYCYPIKYRAKRKHWLSLKEPIYSNIS